MAWRQLAVLVVDDDRGFAAFVCSLLKNAGIEPLESDSAEQAIAVARRRRPDAAIIDVVLPGRGGYGLCRELREEHGDDLPVMFVSGERAGAEDRTTGILVGGDDYLVKPVHPEELLARLRRLLERSRPLGRASAPDLSEREIEVLQLVAEGLPPAQVSRRLHITQKTVSSHMQRIFGKLNAHTRAQAVAIAYQAGLIHVSQGSVNGEVEVEAHLAAVPAIWQP